MTSRLDSQIIPTRFLMTMAHFIAVIMVIYTKQNNILDSLSASYTSSEYDSAKRSVDAAVALSIICLCFEFIGLMAGISMFMLTLNGFDIFAHFVGGMLTCWYIIDSWHYVSIWYIWVFFCFLPAMFEAVAFIRVFCCRVVAY